MASKAEDYICSYCETQFVVPSLARSCETWHDFHLEECDDGEADPGE